MPCPGGDRNHAGRRAIGERNTMIDGDVRIANQPAVDMGTACRARLQAGCLLPTARGAQAPLAVLERGGFFLQHPERGGKVGRLHAMLARELSDAIAKARRPSRDRFVLQMASEVS